MMRRLLLLAIVLFGCLHNTYAQSTRERIHLTQNAYGLLLPEGKVHFAFDNKKLIVKLKPGVNPAAFFREHSSLFAAYNESWKVPFPEVYRPVLRAGSGKTYDQTVAQLEANPDVAYVAPVVQYRGLEQSLYDLFYVKLKNAADLSFLQAQAQELGFTIGERQDGDIYFCHVDKTSAGNSFEIAARLQSLHRFTFVEPDFIYTCKLSTSDPSFNAQWYLNNTGSSAQYSGTAGADMKVTQAWGITTGVSTIRVAVLDCFGSTAQFTHPDITFAATYDATGTGFNSSTYTGDAHGICCAGIIRATANNNLGGAGIAYNAGVIAVKVGTITNSSGNWSTTGNSISNGITWAYQNADVISNSNTFGSSNSLINTAIANGLTSGRSGKGTLFFSSAGNSNTTTIGYPASYAPTIAVAATSMCDQRKSPTSCDGETWWGSDYGTGVDIGAPGVKIYTTDLPGTAGYSTDDYAATFNGTSSACPAAAAVMALILSANPNLTATSARALMESTCAKVGGYTYNASVSGQPNGTWSTDLGYGRVDAFAALSALNPCTGTPSATTISAPASACNGVAFTISSNASANGGITYQWESSANGTSGWSAISGATSSTISVSNLSATTYYRQLVTCTTSNQAVYSNVVSVAFTPAAQCYCTPTTTGATTYNITNFTTTGGQTNINNTSSGTTGYQNFSTTASASASPGMSMGYSMTVAGGSTYGRAIWIDFNENGSFADAGEQVVSSTAYASSPMTGSFMVPAGATAGTKRMRIVASYIPANPSDPCTLSNTGEYEDYGFVVSALSACTGTPTATTIAAPASACNGVAFTVSSTATISGGVVYQWESSANGTSGWSVISGATGTTLSVSNLSATTYYRQLVTCTTSSQAVYSNVVSVALLPATQCYCTPVISTQDELITNITVAGINNSNTGFGTSGYQNFTNITGTMQIGAGYPFSATIAPYYSSDAIAVWIDYDQNGVFDNPGERVLLKAPTATPSTGTITVPATALTGNTRMRVRLDYSNTNPTPCGNTSYGNVEDYTINITPCPAQSVVATASTLTPCAGTSVTFTASPTNGGATPLYQWKVNGTPVSGATSSTYTTSFSASSQVSVVMTPTTPCPATPTVESSALNVAVTPTVTPSVSVAASANPAIAGRSVTFTATPTNGGTTPQYQWTQNGTSVGGNSDVFTTNTLNDGDVVSCTLTSNATCATPATASSNIAMTITPDTCSTSISASGPTTFCAGSSVTLTASAGASYLWSNGETTQSITIANSGNYSVTVANANGCSAAAAAVVTVNAVPDFNLTASGALSFCDGGSVTLALDPASVVPASASYQWFSNGTAISGATQSSYTANATGAYSLTITDGNGCSNTSVASNAVVNPIPTASISASGATTFCAGGSVTLTASAGASYLWSNGETTQSITVTNSGNYSVKVMNSDGCEAISAVVAVGVQSVPAFGIVTNGPLSFCDGGSVLLSFDATTAASGYQWLLNGAPISGATTPNYAATTAGAYALTITDVMGCSGTSPVSNVVVNPIPVASISASGPTTFCAGGSVVLTASGGNTYQWSNGETTPSITVTASGSYSVSAVNGDCSATSSAVAVTVNAVPDFNLTASGALSFCDGGSVVLSLDPASVVPASASYQWFSNGTAISGATQAAYTATTAGAYALMISDGNGCSNTSVAGNVIVNPIPVASISASGATMFCAGGSATLTASAGASYLWSNGETTQSITVTNSGNYSVTVANASGCSATSAATTITVNSLPVAAISTNGPNPFCAGTTVPLLASPNGAGNTNTYRWTLGTTTLSNTTAQHNATAAGSYTVRVTDANGCAATSPAFVLTVKTPPAAFNLTANGVTTFCAGGSVTLSPNTSTANLGSFPNYQWKNNGTAIPGATALSYPATASGNYTLTVSDNAGCSGTSVARAVVVNPLPVASFSAPLSFCAGSSATLQAAVYSGQIYAWILNGASVSSGATRTITTGGTYQVRATLGSCTALSAAKTITVNALPVASISNSGQNPVCAGSTTTLVASPAGATTYRWTMGTTVLPSTTAQQTASAAGSYTVRVTDANGCAGTSPSYTLSVKTPPVFSITANAATTFCAGGSVTLSPNITVSTAAAYPNYQWSDNGVAISGATAVNYVATASGNYTITIADSAGCGRASTARAVVANPNPIASFTAGGPTTFCSGGSVVLTAAAYPSQTYTWLLNGVASSTGATRTVTNAGNYQVRATLGSCTALSPAQTVTVNPLPATALSLTGPNPFCQGNTVVLNATPVAATNTYSWTLGTTVLPTTTAQLPATAGGSYKVTVTDANGCARTSTAYSLTMSAMPQAAITALGSTTIGTGGSVTLQAPSGTGYAYQWFKNNVAVSGATGRSAVITSGGSYTVRVTNGACVQMSAAVVVTQTAGKESLGVTAGGSDGLLEEAFSFSAFPNPAGDKVMVRTNGALSQSATVQVMSLTGAAVKEVEMRDAQTEIDLSGMATGVYLLRYKDAEGRTGIIRLVKQ